MAITPILGAADYTFTMLAGSGGGSSSADGVGSAASFLGPNGVAMDGAGNLYVVDTSNHTIRKVTPAGEVTTLAGAPGLVGSADGTKGEARFNFPAAIVVDGSGTLYVTDGGNNTIRKITPDGTVTTWVGMAGVAGNTDGAGFEARFRTPYGIAIGPDANFYVCDAANHSIRKITPAGVVTTLAGQPGSSGTADGAGVNARFNFPNGLCLDAAGNVYVADGNNHTVRRITPAGEVSTFAGTAGAAATVDGVGNAARISWPSGIAIDPEGNLYVSESFAQTIRKITPTAVVSTLLGQAGQGGYVNGTVAQARLRFPRGIAIGAVNTVYVVDLGNNAIRKLSADGTVETMAGGNGRPGDADGTGGAAEFNPAATLAVDASGAVWVNDASSRSIRKISATGLVSTLARNMSVAAGRGLALDRAGNGYVTDELSRVYRVSAAGEVTLFSNVPSGTPAVGFGSGGLAIDQSDNVYVVRRGSNFYYTITKITQGGEETILAGFSGTLNSSGIGADKVPEGLAVDRMGNVYIADTQSHTIRKITPSGRMTILAGTAGVSGSADGQGAGARFNTPTSIAVNKYGYLYVADNGNATLRGITPEGVVTTLAGQAGIKTYATGLGSATRFITLRTVAVGDDGLIYTDSGYNTVLVGSNLILPAITAGPLDQVVVETATVTFSVTATGGYVNYQWRKDGVPILGSDQSSLVLRDVQANQAGSYDVVVSNHVGSVTSAPATLQISPVAVISNLSDARQVLTVGADLNLTVTATGTGELHYQWVHNGKAVAGVTTSSYTMTGVAKDDGGWYGVLITDDNGTRRSAPIFVLVAPANPQVVAWGYSDYGRTTVPPSLSGVVALSAGSGHTLALKIDGAVVGWGGSNSYGELDIPADLSDVVAVAAGATHSLALKSDGTVVAWGGRIFNHRLATQVPADLRGVVAISAGYNRSIALKNDGTVVSWGAGDEDDIVPMPVDLSNVTAVSAGSNHVLALTVANTVIAWGGRDFYSGSIEPPADLSDVVEVAAGSGYSMALGSDGKPRMWGAFYTGGIDPTVIGPGVLSSLKAIAGGYSHAVGLKADGTVVAWGGSNYYGESTPPAGLTNVWDISAGNNFTVILRDASSTVATQSITFGVLADRGYFSTPITLMATATSGLPVTFSVSAGPASISGDQLTLTGTGLIVVQATQAGNGSYLAAEPVERSFMVTANRQSWEAEHFTSEELADAAISGPAADPDEDGLVNLVEYALGLGPKAADAAGLPEVGTTATEWVYTYTRPAERGDISYAVEASTDMASWSTSGVTHTWVSTAGGVETWRATYPLGSAANLFFRLKVQEN